MVARARRIRDAGSLKVVKNPLVHFVYTASDHWLFGLTDRRPTPFVYTFKAAQPATCCRVLSACHFPLPSRFYLFIVETSIKSLEIIRNR